MIGYLAQQFPEKVTILSTDQDYIQLVSDNVSVFSPVKKTIYYPETVLKEYGIPPHNFLTHKVIVGDKGDNVPGVRGIGMKTLVKLFPELKSEEVVGLKEILTKSATLPGKYTDIYNYRKQLDINQKLMDLRNPNIPEQNKALLDSVVLNPRDNYDPTSFLKLCKEDQIEGSLRTPQIWLTETFSKLKDYKLED